ncbi:hypothetical protein SDC9_135236 [bioreactor metagenome]|uniref:Uncharacterized protein n=1 Tax=bioreactor metagenome TaxID=1076179 RepID=A0A645DFY6_9ZZZZ
MLRLSASTVPRRRLFQSLRDRWVDVTNDKIGRHHALLTIAMLGLHCSERRNHCSHANPVSRRQTIRPRFVRSSVHPQRLRERDVGAKS